MPIYCYTTEQGFTYERLFAMGKAPKTVRTEYGIAERDIRAEHGGFKTTHGNWPMESDAMGVNPEQAVEAEAEAASFGVPTDFNRKTGCAKVTSKRHHDKLVDALGLVERNRR